MRLSVQRMPEIYSPDATRVIARFFMPGVERARGIMGKIDRMSDEQVQAQLELVLMNFSQRHRNITGIFARHYEQVRACLRAELGHEAPDCSRERALLTGSYFTMEYAIEAAAFFNPSIVPHPNQEGLEEGQQRVIVSFRAIGEGHISSVVFRSGIITGDNRLVLDPAGSHVELPEKIQRHVYGKANFRRRLDVIKNARNAQGQAISGDLPDLVMDRLGDRFNYGELLGAVEGCLRDHDLSVDEKRQVEAITHVAHAHYEMSFSPDTALSERVIFPFSSAENKGIEDTRFVRFVDDDGTVTYFSTYTAYSDRGILPKFITTADFSHFKVRPINGVNARNKGMALFPRRINGRFAMLARIDGMSNYIMFSDEIDLWEEKPCRILEPTYPWEFIQVGNCGSPIETEKGWLLLTHGVGPMRSYSIGAVLLDLDDPTRVIARLEEPLMIPEGHERNGYVPNVVYSCGALLNNGRLIIPYGLSDYASGFATVPLDEIFRHMRG